MPKYFGNIYKGKKVFITGHTGFKGSWLSFWLTRLGAEIFGYSLDIPTRPSHFKLLDLDTVSIEGNILDRNKLLRSLKNIRPDMVFHLAAQPIVRDSYRDPIKTFETNIMGTVNVLESCRKVDSVRAIVNVTSDKCYQNDEQKKFFKETDPLGGNDPYSASKAGAEIVSNAYRQSFFDSVLLANVRAGNVIGGGDWGKDRLIPDIVRAASQGGETMIRNPHSIRPWQHVLEPLNGYLQLGWRLLEGKKQFADNWNFGPEPEASLKVLDIIRRSRKHWDKISFEVQSISNNLREAESLMLDSAKARRQLDWQNVWGIDKAIAKTICWYRDYYQNRTINSYSDLEEYVSNASKRELKWTK